MSQRLRIAVPKGRLLTPSLEAFQAAGFEVPTRAELASRRLVFDREDVEWILVKDGDVPVYVEHGAADAGIAGLDQITEHGADLLQPLAMPFGRCRMMLIAPAGTAAIGRTSRGVIATKYPNVTRRFLASRGLAMDIVTLQGSVELAAVLRLAPWIVDLVETGETARVHGLELLETIFEVEPRLVINRSSWIIEPGLRDLVERMQPAVVGAF